MSARAGVVVTGTEVLTGLVTDRNGPWVSQRLREAGVDCAYLLVVGDRPAELRAAVSFLAAQQVDLVVTSGGLGPTADDLTADVVAEVTGRTLALDPALEERVWAIVEGFRARWGTDVDEDAMRAGARKQAHVPEGATVLEPVGTAPGLVVPWDGGPTVLVLPGPPRELQGMWDAALAAAPVRAALAGAEAIETRMIRMVGVPEPEIAATLRAVEEGGLDLSSLEVTTCLRRGELEVSVAFGPAGERTYAQLEAALVAHHGSAVFSVDGATVDEQVLALLGERELTVAVAESCTGGLMAGRLTARPGSSSVVLGGVTAYANSVKSGVVGVDPGLIESVGAVSVEVARSLADGACRVVGSSVGLGITGIAGPGGGTPDKPVGTVCFSACLADGSARLDRRVVLPGGRDDVRDRSTTYAMHLLRRLLTGEHD